MTLIERLAFSTAIVLIAAIRSCHAADTETIIEELAYQGLHVADLQQTLDIHRHPYYFERSNMDDAGWLIGPHPSQQSIYAYMGTVAVVHAAVTFALVKAGAPRWALRTWQAITIADAATNVACNASIGLRIHL